MYDWRIIVSRRLYDMAEKELWKDKAIDSSTIPKMPDVPREFQEEHPFKKFK